MNIHTQAENNVFSIFRDFKCFEAVTHPVMQLSDGSVGFLGFYLCCLCDTCMVRFENVGTSAFEGSWENENKRRGEPRAK